MSTNNTNSELQYLQRQDLKRKNLQRRKLPAARTILIAVFLAACSLHIATQAAPAETCTTQSGLSDADRNALADAARGFATKVQANDAAGLRATTIAEVAKDFGAVQYLVAVTAPKLTGGVPIVDQVYVLDATGLQRNPDGSAPDAQFFCSLNRSTMEADFMIPALPPGKYGFAIVNITPPAGSTLAPWRLSFLMRQEPPNQPQAKWMLAGFYPKPIAAGGHDGLWYWTQARQSTKDHQPWNAWLYYQEAQKLLQPAPFVLSSHLEKLRAEAAAAAPPALSEGISIDAPLVIKAADGVEYHFTGLSVDDSQEQSALDIAAHLHLDPAAGAPTDAAAARKRNDAAASALLAAYPELRKPFHGIWIYAEATGQNPFSSEQSIADIK